MPIGRYIGWVGTSLLLLLFVASWLFPHSVAAPNGGDETNRPVVRIASVQKLPERIVIDTSLPTILPPRTVVPNPVSIEEPARIQRTAVQPPPSPVSITPSEIHEVKRKYRTRREPGVLAHRQPLSIAPPIGTVAEPISPPTRLSLADIVSGQLVRRLLNLH